MLTSWRWHRVLRLSVTCSSEVSILNVLVFKERQFRVDFHRAWRDLRTWADAEVSWRASLVSHDLRLVELRLPWPLVTLVLEWGARSKWLKRSTALLETLVMVGRLESWSVLSLRLSKELGCLDKPLPVLLLLLLRLEIIRVLLLRRVLVLLLLQSLHELLQTLHVYLRIHILNIWTLFFR